MTERRADLLSAGRWQALERPACLLSRTLAVFFTGFLVVLSGLVNPPASASGFFHPEARVATIAEPVSQFVGFHGSVLAVEGRQRSLSYDRSATGSSVAARSGTPRIATTPVRATSHAYDPARSQSWRQLTAPVVDARSNTASAAIMNATVRPRGPPIRRFMAAEGGASLDQLAASGTELDPADAGGQLTRAGRAYANASEVFGPTSGGRLR